MKAKAFLVATLVSAAALGFGQATAQISLGDAAADEAVAALAEAAGAGVELDCTFVGGWVTCAGAKVGVCLSVGWLVNHSGGTCRKKVT